MDYSASVASPLTVPVRFAATAIAATNYSAVTIKAVVPMTFAKTTVVRQSAVRVASSLAVIVHV